MSMMQRDQWQQRWEECWRQRAYEQLKALGKVSEVRAWRTIKA